MKRILIFGLLLSLLVTKPCYALTKDQWDRADTIAEIASDSYEEYGVLPSIAIAQAFIESTLGECCSGNNLWGINSGAESYSSLEDGVVRYLNVINNGCYDDALYERNYRSQIRKILNGGYCEPEGSYYSDVVWSIEHYDFDKYDKDIPKMYALKYSKDCPDFTIQMNSKKCGRNTVVRVREYLFETELNKDIDKDTIIVPEKRLDGELVSIDIFKNVKG